MPSLLICGDQHQRTYNGFIPFYNINVILTIFILHHVYQYYQVNFTYEYLQHLEDYVPAQLKQQVQVSTKA